MQRTPIGGMVKKALLWCVAIDRRNEVAILPGSALSWEGGV